MHNRVLQRSTVVGLIQSKPNRSVQVVIFESMDDCECCGVL